jgi:hypothetical protein
VKNFLNLQSLRELLLSGYPQELLEKKLREFSCERDPDVESFIKTKAFDYERSGYSRTYLYECFNDLDGKSEIVAYFTVAMTSVSFTEISKNRKAKVLGGFPGRTSLDHFAGLLIAQLARCDKYDGMFISGQRLIEDAEDVIEQGRQYLGGKIIYLDCKEPLISFYERNGYVLLAQSPSSQGLSKMFKVLPKLPQRSDD